MTYELHGWLTIRSSPGGDDFTDAEMETESVIARLLPDIRALQEMGVHAELIRSNADVFVRVDGAPNHSGTHTAAVHDVYSTVASTAPGSYGILYVWDDEDRDFSNVFQVWVLARGRVERRSDQFFSPCIPTIEDPSGDPYRS